MGDEPAVVQGTKDMMAVAWAMRVEGPAVLNDPERTVQWMRDQGWRLNELGTGTVNGDS